ALVDALIAARLEGDRFHHLAHESRHAQPRFRPFGPRLLFGDRDAVAELRRVVRLDLRTDAILEWSDDLPAGGVVLRIRREHEHDVERETDGVALNLHVPLLHDVEQTDLDLAGEIR